MDQQSSSRGMTRRGGKIPYKQQQLLRRIAACETSGRQSRIKRAATTGDRRAQTDEKEQRTAQAPTDLFAAGFVVALRDVPLVVEALVDLAKLRHRDTGHSKRCERWQQAEGRTLTRERGLWKRQ